MYRFQRIVSVFCVVGLSAASASATTFSNIEKMGLWETCASCAARGGTGPAVNHSVAFGVSSPSMDGNSAEFSISGGFPFADAIWWKQLGGNSAATNFTYDLYFYMTDPSASEGLEFDVNQSADGRKFIYGTQCGLNYDHQWDVWDPAGGTWRPTGIPCSVNASGWNHLTWQFYRANGSVHYVSVTLNGVTYPVNAAYTSIPAGGSEINVAFQMDQTASARPYAVWLNKVTLSY